MSSDDFIFGAKCAPERDLLAAIDDAGLRAVELFINARWLEDVPDTVALCRPFPFRYAIHAPDDVFRPVELAELAAGINAEVVVFHNTLWDDEWDIVRRALKETRAQLCVENVATILEPVKFMRRFGMGRCLDLEHLQLETGGIFEEEFLRVMKTACHVHMSGYSAGSRLWHTPIHHSPEHCLSLLRLLKKARYRGMIVSEAHVRFQTREEFSRLSSFVASLETALPMDPA